MNNNDAIPLLYSKGIRVQAEGWDAFSFVEVVDGAVVDQDGKAFDITKSEATRWQEWSKPLEKSGLVTFTKEVTIVSLYTKGRRVQAEGWDAFSFVEVVDGAVVDQDGKAFDITKSEATRWQEWSKPLEKSGISSALVKMDNLEKMLEEALKQKSDALVVKPAKQSNDAHEKIMAVYGVDSAEKVRQLFRGALSSADSEREVQIAIVHAIPYCWIDRSLRTTKSYYAEMRKIVKEVSGEFEEMALDLLLPPYRVETKIVDGVEQEVAIGLYQSLNESDEVKVIDKMGEDNQEVYNLDDMKQAIAKLKNMIDNEEFSQSKQTSLERAKAYVYASYLAMVTGRRQIEILYTLKMTHKKEAWFYEGLAKKDGDSKIEAYALDKDFIKLNEMLKYVQKHILSQMKSKEITTKTVASKFNGSFNRALHNLTGVGKQDVKPYKFSDMREIAVDMITIEACENEEVDCSNPIEIEKFKAKVLGHSVPKGSLRATLHYMTKKGVSNDS